MKRLGLILAVAVFAGVAGSAVAQTELDGKARKVPGAERHTSDRTEEERRRPDREESAPTVTREWLSEPPGTECRNAPEIDSRMVASSAASNGSCPFNHPCRCAIRLASQMNDCVRQLSACLSVWSWPKCAGKAAACAAKAEAEFAKCVAKYD